MVVIVKRVAYPIKLLVKMVIGHTPQMFLITIQRAIYQHTIEAGRPVGTMDLVAETMQMDVTLKIIFKKA